jgi:hypothetical protein
METKPYSLQSPEVLAKEYGGNKQKIAQAAQMGLIDPTAAVLAGMFIDRMRGAQMQEQAPMQTVAQETLVARPPMPQGAPQAGAGLEALPVPDEMFGAPGMAGGGLVAFAEAGEIDLDALEEQRRKNLELARRQSGILGFLLPDTLPEGKLPDTEAPVGQDQSMPVVTGMEEYGVSPEMLVPRDRPRRAPTPASTPVEVGVVQDIPEIQVEADLPPQPRRDRGNVNRTRTETPAQESALDQYAKMLLGSMGDREASREDARNMALLQAGLGIMGGTSQYAAENIARGALPATQSYQQQMQQMREDERKTIGALADLELKAKELGLTEKRYNDLVRIAQMQVAAAQGKTTGVSAKDVAKMKSDIVTDLTKDGMTPIDQAILQADQIVNYALGLGGPTAGGRPTIKWGSIQ